VALAWKVLTRVFAGNAAIRARDIDVRRRAGESRKFFRQGGQLGQARAQAGEREARLKFALGENLAFRRAIDVRSGQDEAAQARRR
jgi:hypothetical protein